MAGGGGIPVRLCGSLRGKIRAVRRFCCFPRRVTLPIPPGAPRKDADPPRVEPATIDDLAPLTDLVLDLMARSGDFTPDRTLQERGLRLILEQPNRGRIFVVRNKDRIFGMVNLLFTISTARGGFVILMEDVVIHPDHRGQGFGSMLIDHVVDFAKKKNFKRITLLTDRLSAESQRFFEKHGFTHSQMIPMRRMIG
jgi:GNAT superfamily N-acetyltransferase